MSRLVFALFSLLPVVQLVVATQTGKIYFQGNPNEVSSRPTRVHSSDLVFRVQCLGVNNPVNEAVTGIFSCTNADVHTDWVFNQPGDNMSVQLANTTL
jgi:hypothetical protein